MNHALHWCTDHVSDCFAAFAWKKKLILPVVFFLFRILRRFQHCTGHITMGSWKGRGNQYIQFVRVLYCKLPTNGKQNQGTYRSLVYPFIYIETENGKAPTSVLLFYCFETVKGLDTCRRNHEKVWIRESENTRPKAE